MKKVKKILVLLIGMIFVLALCVACAKKTSNTLGTPGEGTSSQTGEVAGESTNGDTTQQDTTAGSESTSKEEINTSTDTNSTDKADTGKEDKATNNGESPKQSGTTQQDTTTETENTSEEEINTSAGTQEQSDTASQEENTSEETASQTEQSTTSSQASGSNGASGASDGTPYAQHGRLSVNGTALTDEHGAAYQLQGVSTHGIGWFPQYVNEDTFAELKSWGVNAVRLAMYTAEGGYCEGGDANKDNLKALIDKGVQAATDLGMYVIIDWHVLNDHDPWTYADEAEKFFAEMSQKYKDYGNVIYEICNEPNSGPDWSSVKAYAEKIIPVIRENAPDAVIIVGTPTWSQDVDKAAADPITGYDNIMYALHFYADTHRDYLRDRMKSAIDAGLPVIVSEFGICDASGNGGNNYDEGNKWIEAMDNCNVSYFIWNLSNKAETSALISSGCDKLSGFADSELSDSGRWYKELLSK